VPADARRLRPRQHRAPICTRAKEVFARVESRHVHGVRVDSRGDIYAGLTQHRTIDKFIRKG
jgi:hypothetical protein